MRVGSVIYFPNWCGVKDFLEFGDVFLLTSS